MEFVSIFLIVFNYLLLSSNIHEGYAGRVGTLAPGATNSSLAVRRLLRNRGICNCGVANKPRNHRIYGGVEASPHEYPWIVKLAGNTGCTGKLSLAVM